MTLPQLLRPAPASAHGPPLVRRAHFRKQLSGGLEILISRICGIRMKGNGFQQLAAE
jgi:hypothetical protein